MSAEDASREAGKAERSVIVECELAAPPEKVWRALTIPELVAAWLMPNDMHPAVGKRFSFAAKPHIGGKVACEVLEAKPHTRLSYSWRGDTDERDGSGNALDTVVTFELTRTRTGGTHLRLVHDGFRAAMARPALAAPRRRPITAMAGTVRCSDPRAAPWRRVRSSIRMTEGRRRWAA